jgi:hypothetical protein
LRRGLALVLALSASFGWCGESSASDYRAVVEQVSQACGRPDSDDASPYRVGRVICLRGRIDQSFSRAFFQLSPRPGDVVVTSGPGGDIAAAMDIGDLVYRDNLLVVVDRICVSSCAYFIALGGKRLAMTSGGMLGFHGGPVSEKSIMDNPTATASEKAKLLADSKRFAEFFKSRGLDISITYEVPPTFQGQNVDWTTNMWVRSAKELPRFGFHGVVYCAGGVGCGAQ